jgi:hypothetical protein
VLSGDDVALKIQADVYRFSSLTAVPRQTTNVESLIGLSCQVTREIEYFTGGRRSPAKTVSGTTSRFSQIDVTWLYLNVVMQKKKPCAGGSAGFHLSTGNFRAVAFASSVGSRSDQLDNTAAEF